MTMSRLPRSGVAFLLVAAVAACGTAVQSAHTSVQSGAPARAMTPAEQARADSGRMPFTAADVHFMQGMIHHHAQAVVMAQWVPTHGARPDVQALAQRIGVAQRDEIAFMQRWLRERHQDAPDPLAHFEMGHDMADMHMVMMPGMLTPEQMKQLDAARGPEFDRLFLTFMIQHHQGAITMVDQLFAVPGAGQELYVFRFASDVNADQTTEIERMRLMLGADAK
jgi:uncharacterized protein (DUF305 family)